MPYTNREDMPPALQGIDPPITTKQGSKIAEIADAIAKDKDNKDVNPWAVAIATWKRSHKVVNGKWVSKKEMAIFEDKNEPEYELEKKWKIKSQPPVDQLKQVVGISETYSSIHPVCRIREMTFQDKKPKYFHATKYRVDGDRDRIKFKVEIDKDTYDQLNKLIDMKPVIKTRSIYDIGNGLMAKVDNFKDGNQIVEVEFSSKDAMNNFVPPSWFGQPLNTNISISEKVFRKVNGIPEDEKTLFEYNKIKIDDGYWR